MGESLKFEGTEASVSAQLQQAVLESKLSGSLQALQTTVSGEGAREEKRAAVRDLPGLRALYRPILHRMYGGMQKGFVIAALWEALYQSWALLERYQTIAVVIVFWVPVLALLGFVLFEEQIAKIITWLIPAFIAGALMGHSPMQAISLDSIVQPLTPTIGALLVSVAFATVLGLSGGAGIAGVWALLHRRNLPVAPDGPLRIGRLSIGADHTVTDDVRRIVVLLRLHRSVLAVASRSVSPLRTAILETAHEISGSPVGSTNGWLGE